MEPEFSVVIPTHDRVEILPEVLAALEIQREPPPFEIIVIDDGSTDGTAERLADRRPAVPFRFARQANRGPATARNHGVRLARGGWIAFLGDDTVPAPDWLARHAAAHRERGDAEDVAVLGYTAWHRRMRLDPFLRYINEQGLQFGYGLIRDRERVAFNFFYTSNISLSRRRLLEEPFDERFPYPAWEDIEAAYRMTKRGLRLVYEPGAVVEHDHATSFARFATRQESAGFSAVVFYRRHPELGAFLGLSPAGPPPLPSPAVQRGREALVRALHFLPVSLPRLWEAALRYHYIRGLHRGWMAHGSDPEGDVA